MLLNTFSPRMLAEGCECRVKQVTFEEIEKSIVRPWYWDKNMNDTGFEKYIGGESAIGHEVTAHVLSIAFNAMVPFQRKNVVLKHRSIAYIVIPNFRANEAREFTREEVVNAGFRCFRVNVWNPSEKRFGVRGQLCDVGGSPVTGGDFETLEEARRALSEFFKEDNMESAWIIDVREEYTC